MTSPIDEAMRDFAVNKLNKEVSDKHPREDQLFTWGYNEETGNNYCDIYGWGFMRIYRDENKRITRIHMIKDGDFLELIDEKLAKGRGMK